MDSVVVHEMVHLWQDATDNITNLIDKVENPINLTDANIKDLIAAIMLIINREVA